MKRGQDRYFHLSTDKTLNSFKNVNEKLCKWQEYSFSVKTVFLTQAYCILKVVNMYSKFRAMTINY